MRTIDVFRAVVLVAVVWLVLGRPLGAQKAPAVAELKAKGPGVATINADSPAPVALPTLSPDDALLVRGVLALAAIANKECSALSSSQQYLQHRQQVQSRLEQKYTGLTVDWAGARLVAKAPPAVR